MSTTTGPLQPGTRIVVRGEEWQVRKRQGNDAVDCIGLSGIIRGKVAQFLPELEKIEVIDPAAVDLVPDRSPAFVDTRLYVEATARRIPPTDHRPQLLGRAAIDDLAFQHVPVEKALSQSRLRLLVADDVGLGKTLEAGMIAAEQILRGRAERILVISTRAMLNQFQKEFWTRFSIPLARLDSSAIRRMKNSLPAHYNVFDQFQRVIVSIDTLKRDLQYRQALEDTRWDLVIIDEAHNAADRNNKGAASLRARLAALLSRKADALLLLTATPHDGSQESFASLIRMLDPARLPEGTELEREEIEDLVVRRFRHTPEVAEALGQKVKSRKLERHEFEVTSLEERAYEAIAGLEIGDGERGSALFRVTIAKAMFSSPAACLETVENRLHRKVDSEDATTALQELRETLLPLDAPGEFSKYQELLALLRRWKWTGKKPRDRIVLFSERIATLNWLRKHLAEDLNLPDEAIGQISGGGMEADERSQQVLEDFAQERRPLRILLASDMASEGLNLHFHSHRLIHFDLPWSLLRFQQRNGRIDRYGQEHVPEIHYLVGLSAQPKIRDMWVLEKLVEKDEAAQRGLSDPAVFMGKGAPEKEEDALVEMVARGVSADDLGTMMEENASTGAFDLDDILFGAFDAAPQPPTTVANSAFQLYGRVFDFATDLLTRMQELGDAPENLRIDRDESTIGFTLPDDLKTSSDFGYARKGQVDERYMPPEAALKGQVMLSDQRETINTAIAQARFSEDAWPQTQYLWEVHPITGWFIEHARARFGRRKVPLCRLESLSKDEVAVLLQGSVTDRAGRIVDSLWQIVRLSKEHGFTLGNDGGWKITGNEDPSQFLERSGFDRSAINPGSEDVRCDDAAIRIAVQRFQEDLHLRAEKLAAGRANFRSEEEARLDTYRGRFERAAQLRFDLLKTDREREAERRRLQDEKEIEALFADWQTWIDNHCEIVRDKTPHVDVVAVFEG